MSSPEQKIVTLSFAIPRASYQNLTQAADLTKVYRDQLIIRLIETNLPGLAQNALDDARIANAVKGKTSKTDILVARLAKVPCTKADLQDISNQPWTQVKAARELGAIIEYDAKAKPAPVYRMLKAPDKMLRAATKKGQRNAETAQKEAAAASALAARLEEKLKPEYRWQYWSAADFERETGLPAATLNLRWSAGKFPTRVILERLQAAVDKVPACKPAIKAMRAKKTTRKAKGSGQL